jgi:S-DNA-T family DNA segregation ATPase FtsK/SpoIIIE
LVTLRATSVENPVSTSSPSPVSSVPVREIGLVGLAAAAVYTLLAIVSYSPLDPSFTYSGSGTDVENLVGRSGAWFADVMLYLFGVVAYVVPLAFVIMGLRLVRGAAEPWSWGLVSIRGMGWIGLIICCCVLAQVHFTSAASLPAGVGGVLGQWLGQVGEPVFGWVGLTLLCLAGLLIGAQAAAGFSWLSVSEVTGRWIHLASRGAVSFVDRRLDMWRSRQSARAETRENVASRKEARQKSEKQAATRTQPKIAAPEKPKPKARQQKLFDLKTSGELPDLDLLDERADDDDLGYSEESLTAMSRLLELKLADFGIDARVESVLPGPVVTRFEIQPAPGVKVQRISALAKDLARSLAVISVRIVEVIPGKSVVGIEIPNEHREIVRLKEILADPAFQESKSPLTLALGKDIMGEPQVADISRMPHLLVAGTTGSGKSVGVNAMLLSILCKSTPDEVRMILVDPKMLELSIYEGIPHLLTPVVTDMKDAAMALNWCVAEMERRYRLMAALGVRNLAGFNRQVADAEKGGGIPDPLWNQELDGEPPLLEKLPLIVVVIDEFADMMMIVGKKVEQLIARIAQKARAAGIHLVLATQRPSVDVITGLIKANIPTRISFQVSSKVDSRTILDQGGAEQLLGHGDMLYLPPGSGVPTRVHGAFVSDDEVHRIVEDWKQRAEPDYRSDVLTGGEDELFVAIENGESSDEDDPLYDEAVSFVIESRRASISSVQRKLRIGYNRAARLIEAMEAAGVVSGMGSNGSREVLVPNRD